MPRKIIPTEHQEAEAFATWLRINRYRFTHIPNEGSGSVARGRKLKREGVSAGFPDYVIFLKNGLTLFIELKRQNGVATTSQKSWGKFLREFGHLWFVCKGWEQARSKVEECDTGLPVEPYYNPLDDDDTDSLF